jgi:hypothetical protein
MAKQIDISRIVGIPVSTLIDWKNAKDYRKLLYFSLLSMTLDELKAFVENGNSLLLKKQKDI